MEKSNICWRLYKKKKKSFTSNTEVASANDKIEAPVLEIMIARFPHVVTNIFKELDDETLTTCIEVSRLWCDHLEDQQFFWVRRIQRYSENMKYAHPQWKKVFKNTPVEYVKELSVSTEQFFKYKVYHFSNYGPRNEYQYSPLLIVAIVGNFELFKYVFEKMKTPKPSNPWTTLLLADIVGYGIYTHSGFTDHVVEHEEICKFLINHSEEKNPSEENGMTLFHYAAKRGLKSVCKLIIENIGNKNPAARNGCTPLHLAAKAGNLEIVRLIVETGVDKNCLFDGKTPLDMVGQFESFIFHQLLSNDKFQLGKVYFNNLILTFLLIYTWLCIFLFLAMMITIEMFYHAFPYFKDHVTVGNSMLLGTLVIFIISLPLTIKIRAWVAAEK